MISTGNVSLRAARQDCGYSATGGLKGVQAFKDRTGQSNPSLKSLRGTILAMSVINAPTLPEGRQSNTNWSRETFVSHTPNVNGYCSYTLYGTLQNKFNSYLLAQTKSEESLLTTDALLGWAFIGKGTGSIRVQGSTSDGDRSLSFVEFLAWPNGYFSGTPIYLYSLSARSQSLNNVYDVPSSHPYLTLNMQSISIGGSEYYPSNINSGRAFRA
jgi:hypothetical protein